MGSDHSTAKGDEKVSHKYHTQEEYEPDTLYARSVKTDWQCRPSSKG